MEDKKRVGRPSKYSEDLADEILLEMIQGKSLISISKRDDMPSKSTLMTWLKNNKEFQDQYARAIALRADYHAEEILDIADEVVTDHVQAQRQRTRVDARKWIASKLRPIRYGDKIQQEISGPGGKVPVINIGLAVPQIETVEPDLITDDSARDDSSSAD